MPDPDVLARRLERISHGSGQLALGLIGAIGHRYKGVHTAVEALAQLGPEFEWIELRVLGPGDPKHLEALAERLGLAKRVRFCGTVTSGQPVLDWLDNIDIYLQPSLHEGLPRALIEAMSRGCPAIGSTAGGIPELLNPRFLHRPGDAAALAALIRVLVQDRSIQIAQAQHSFETAKAYRSDILNARRAEFWLRFTEDIRASMQPSYAQQPASG
jgi:glycosyltransferase involved in cell wall biosynthesis